MPIKTWIDGESRLVRAEVWGRITIFEIITALNGTVEDADFRAGSNVLSDHRRLEDPLSPPQLHQTVSHLISLREHFAGVRWAAVTGSMASRGMIRMLGAHADRIPMDVRPFDDIDEALAWVTPDASDRLESRP